MRKDFYHLMDQTRFDNEKVLDFFNSKQCSIQNQIELIETFFAQRLIKCSNPKLEEMIDAYELPNAITEMGNSRGVYVLEEDIEDLLYTLYASDDYELYVMVEDKLYLNGYKLAKEQPELERCRVRNRRNREIMEEKEEINRKIVKLVSQSEE